MTPTLVCSPLPWSVPLDVSRNRLRTCADGRAARRHQPLELFAGDGQERDRRFKSPGELADAAGTGVWDIGLIGAEPQRAEKIVFTAAYCEIEATYLVPAGSKLRTIADVDASGVRIAVTARSAYGLWL